MTTLIRVVDLETTGFDPTEHAVCEIGCVDVLSSSTDLGGAPTTFKVVPTIVSTLVNPGRLIPAETSAIHHIIDEDVIGFRIPQFSDAVGMVIGDAIHPRPVVLSAHSAKFERQFLTDELTGGLPWICTYKCALRLWPDAPSHSNQALRYWRKPEGLDRQMANVAHRAGPDAYVTAFHLRDMLAMAPIEDLIKWSSEPGLQVRCHIGQQRGMLWRDVEFSFLEWVSRRDFDEDVLFTVRHEMDRREAEWRAAQATALVDDDIQTGAPF